MLIPLLIVLAGCALVLWAVIRALTHRPDTLMLFAGGIALWLLAWLYQVPFQ